MLRPLPFRPPIVTPQNTPPQLDPSALLKQRLLLQLKMTQPLNFSNPKITQQSLQPNPNQNAFDTGVCPMEID